MLYRIAADALLLLHFAFILYVVLGGLLVLKWRWTVWMHLPCMLWAILLEFNGWICPLTPIEQRLRWAGGEEGYTGSFIEHYLLPLVYPSGLTPEIQVMIGFAVIGINLIIYGLVILRLKKAGA